MYVCIYVPSSGAIMHMCVCVHVLNACAVSQFCCCWTLLWRRVTYIHFSICMYLCVYMCCAICSLCLPFVACLERKTGLNNGSCFFPMNIAVLVVTARRKGKVYTYIHIYVYKECMFLWWNA